MNNTISFFEAIAMLTAAFVLPFDVIGSEEIFSYDKAMKQLTAWKATQAHVDEEALLLGLYLMPVEIITVELVAPLPVIMLDEPLHTDDHPFCVDLNCPCHDDIELYQECIESPYRAGLMTSYEAMRIFTGL